MLVISCRGSLQERKLIIIIMAEMYTRLIFGNIVKMNFFFVNVFQKGYYLISCHSFTFQNAITEDVCAPISAI